MINTILIVAGIFIFPQLVKWAIDQDIRGNSGSALFWYFLALTDIFNVLFRIVLLFV